MGELSIQRFFWAIIVYKAMETELVNQFKKQLSGVPQAPGVYLFKNAEAQIIYIGKAVSLRQRVRSYFNDQAWRERAEASCDDAQGR